MSKISIIGTGNIAYHLCKVFLEKNIDIEVYGRNKIQLNLFENEFRIKTLDNLAQIDSKSIVFLCVNDDEISNLLKELDDKLAIVYTSGTVNLNSLLKRENLGVFYPLQTFSKSREIDFFKVPILIESTNEYFTQTLSDIAWKISSKVEFADSEKRKHLHLAAVFVNNFTNHLMYLAKKQLDDKNLEWELLKPLIQETFNKIKDLDPFDAQTGPAKRMDIKTLKIQEEILNENKLEKRSLEIYKLLSESIVETYKVNKNDKL